MKLVSVRIDHFRNILDSGDVVIEPDVTCLVGKNESGKTSFLQALYRLKPSDDRPFDLHDHYPAWLHKTHSLQGKDLPNVCPVTAVFDLDKEEIQELCTRLGGAVASTTRISFQRRYSGSTELTFAFDEQAWIREFCAKLDVDLVGELGSVESIENLDQKLELVSAKAPGQDEKDFQAQAKEARSSLASACGTPLDPTHKTKEWLLSRIPTFLYFDNHSGLPGVIDIRKIAKTPYPKLDGPEQTAKALLEISNVDTGTAMGEDYQRRKRELENTANALSSEILEYWSQNRDIRVEIDFNQRSSGTPPPQSSTNSM